MTARIIAKGMTPLNKLPLSPSDHMISALNITLKSVNLTLKDIDGLIAVPSLAEPRFMV
jgi:hypothetical protein